MPDASLLVVEDDPAIAALVVRGLRAAGFGVELAADGEVGLARALSGEFDLVVLDLMLPGRSGYDVLEACRARVGLPILVLSARTDLDARLRTFELGALDYLPKPFFVEELVARVRARLRRPAEGPRRVVRFADAEVDVDGRRVSVAGAAVELTTHELSLLLYLLERPGRAVTREQLREGALPYDSDALDRTVDSHISRVRKKLGDAAGARVETVWRIGYRFVPEPDRTARSSAAFERATLFASGDGGGRVGAPQRPGEHDNGASDAEKERAEPGAGARIGDAG